MACKGEDIRKPHVITMFLPRSQGKSTDKLLELIQYQNTVC